MAKTLQAIDFPRRLMIYQSVKTLSSRTNTGCSTRRETLLPRQSQKVQLVIVPWLCLRTGG